MPHFKDGREARLYDRVRFQSGTRYSKDASEPIFEVGRVIWIDAEATCCELTILVGSGKLLGTANLPQFVGDQHPPRAGVILDGYYTTANAKDCKLALFADAPAADHPAAEDQA